MVIKKKKNRKKNNKLNGNRYSSPTVIWQQRNGSSFHCPYIIYYSTNCESCTSKGFGCWAIPNFSSKHSLWMRSCDELSMQRKIKPKIEIYNYHKLIFAFSPDYSKFNHISFQQKILHKSCKYFGCSKRIFHHLKSNDH